MISVIFIAFGAFVAQPVDSDHNAHQQNDKMLHTERYCGPKITQLMKSACHIAHQLLPNGPKPRPNESITTICCRQPCELAIALSYCPDN